MEELGLEISFLIFVCYDIRVFCDNEFIVRSTEDTDYEYGCC